MISSSRKRPLYVRGTFANQTNKLDERGFAAFHDAHASVLTQSGETMCLTVHGLYVSFLTTIVRTTTNDSTVVYFCCFLFLVLH